jgi:hypothetical protein
MNETVCNDLLLYHEVARENAAHAHGTEISTFVTVTQSSGSTRSVEFHDDVEEALLYAQQSKRLSDTKSVHIDHREASKKH